MIEREKGSEGGKERELKGGKRERDGGREGEKERKLIVRQVLFQFIVGYFGIF